MKCNFISCKYMLIFSFAWGPVFRFEGIEGMGGGGNQIWRWVFCYNFRCAGVFVNVFRIVGDVVNPYSQSYRHSHSFYFNWCLFKVVVVDQFYIRFVMIFICPCACHIDVISVMLCYHHSGGLVWGENFILFKFLMFEEFLNCIVCASAFADLYQFNISRDHFYLHHQMYRFIYFFKCHHINISRCLELTFSISMHSNAF